jgi:hypothetical protein
VAHACNPSYFGGRDQEDNSLKIAMANSLWDPVSKKKKKKSQNELVPVAQDEGLEFKPLYHQKKKD